jgi:uncharacterized membrane protein
MLQILGKSAIVRSMNRFLKATLLGGVLFLLPLSIVLMVLAYALKLASQVARPISEQLRLEQWGEFAGIGIVTLLSALLLLLVAFAAGVAARTYVGERITRWFENSLLGNLPQYQMVKSMAEGLAQLESAKGIKPA